MSDLQKVRVQLYDENDNLVGDVDVLTSADCVTFADGQTFQQKLEAGLLKGDTGAKGAAGTAATVAVGTVTTGAAESQAAVSNAGSSTAAVLNFTIPRGADGVRGSQAFTGTGITGSSPAGVIFSGSGVSSALVGDLYINISTGNLYQCTAAGAAAAAKWAYKGTLKGVKGDTGAPGAKGDKGDTGAQGPKGDKGDIGAQGLKGDKGDAGDQGPKGDKGDNGAQGPKGDKGDAGAQGPKGDIGAQGAKGEKGDTGAPGAKGDKGDTGAAGQRGPQGAAGAKGDKGDPGDTIRVGAAYASAVQRKIFFKVVS